MTETKLRQLLEKEVATFPSQRQAAIAIGISPQWLNEMISGNRALSKGIGERYGYRLPSGDERVWIKIK